MTPHVTLKPGAMIANVKPAGIRILGAIDRAAQFLNRVLTITSGSEQRGRLETDPHMTGEAYDVSVNGFTPEEMRGLVRALKAVLGAQFTVLLEVPIGFNPPAVLEGLVYRNASATGVHIHIQRKKGTMWPPAEPTE